MKHCSVNCEPNLRLNWCAASRVLMSRSHEREVLHRAGEAQACRTICSCVRFKLSLDCQRGSRWHNSLYTAFP